MILNISEVKKCPFCNSIKAVPTIYTKDSNVWVRCETCSVAWVRWEIWQSRPIEDDLESSVIALGKDATHEEDSKNYNASLVYERDEQFEKLKKEITALLETYGK